MVGTSDREYLLARAAQLFGENWRNIDLQKMTDEELESLIAEIEMSQSFWDTYDAEVAEIARSNPPR